MFKLILQLHGGGKGSTTQVQSYKPTAEEIRMQKMAADYAEATAPNALELNKSAAKVLWGKDAQKQMGVTAQNFATYDKNARNQIAGATKGINNLITNNTSATNATNKTLGTYVPQFQNAANTTNAQLAGLANGVIPAQYQANMENAIRSGLQNTMGNTINSLGQRGVLNSSVTNAAMNDISRNAADTVAQQYQNNINTIGGLAQQQLGNTNNALESQLGVAQNQLSNTMSTNQLNSGLFGNLIDSAATPISVAAASQEAAQQPALNLWNASIGLNQGGTGTALAGVSGKGTTTSTMTQNGGGIGNSLGGLFGGLASGWASTWCFAEDTLVKMADGTAKFIQDIVKGDKVLCPHKDGTESVEEVLEVMEPHFADVYALTARDKDGNYVVAFTTSTQPVLCADGTFCKVGNLKLMKELHGGLVVQSIEHDEFASVFDLKVSGENNYYADGFVAKGGTTEW